MVFEKSLLCGVILLYSLATLGIFLGVLSSRKRINILANYTTLAGFLLHTVLVVWILFIHSLSEISAGQYLLILPWAVVLIHLCAWQLFRLPFLALTVAPLALLSSIFSLRLTNLKIILPTELSGLFMGIHLTSLFLSIGLLALACGAGCIFLYVDGKMKKKASLGSLSSDFPALSTCDKINKIAVLYGFPCYTLGLVSGFIWAPLFLGAVDSPKILACLILWCFYALLFYQRIALGIRGKKPAKLAILIFAIAIVALGADQVFTHHSQILLSL